MRLASIPASTTLPKIGRSFDSEYATGTAMPSWISQPPTA
jgi:hypothetical protein